MKIEHLALWTTRIEPMRDFYLEHFGCSASAKYVNPASGFNSYFLTFPASGTRLELMCKPGLATADTEPCTGYTHIAISLGSEERVRELTEALRRKGVVVKSEPRRTGDGYYESVVTDPDGNLIELTV
jgi:catechol 2,3-dioxygenase-like lactoylglutathione lyase family enzyme